MGIGFVFVAWILLLGVLALIGAGVLAGTTALVTRKVAEGRRKAIIVAAAFPFCILVYWVFAVVCYSAWCIAVRDVDPGFGDEFYVPLGGGYHLEMIDTEDHPFITGPKEPNLELHSDLSGLQLRKGIVLGSAKNPQKPFFLINTATGGNRVFATQLALEEAAHDAGVSPVKLGSPQSVYRRLRFTVADFIAVAFMLALPALASLILLRRMWTLRGRAVVAPIDRPVVDAG
jgi:hypothetical protein